MVLGPIRLLPSRSYFVPMVGQWSEEAFAEVPPIDDMLDYFS
jgi:hypothetical protein